ncbi:MAG: tRNA lysidine(34) synthetase TilS, partial [Candidatus Atribacteria bacterium]|nr:tRNA lysidine(34) synthetase TilS [Candidatus Atribacteria bacterium]
PWEYNLSVPGQTEIKPLGMEVEFKILNSAEVKTSQYSNRKKSDSEFVEFIDYNEVKYPLKLRNRRIGDMFYPLKMAGVKKVKEFFIDNKVPKGHRDLIPILVDSEGKIVWIVGMRLDDRVKITSDTTKMLYIKIKTKSKLLHF